MSQTSHGRAVNSHAFSTTDTVLTPHVHFLTQSKDVSQFQEHKEETCVLVETGLARLPWKNELGRMREVYFHEPSRLWACCGNLLKCPYYAIFKVANIVLWVS